MGWLYTRLAASNAEPVESEPNEETGLLPRKLNNSVEEFMAMYDHRPSTGSFFYFGTGSCICKSSYLNCRTCSSRRNMSLV